MMVRGRGGAMRRQPTVLAQPFRLTNNNNNNNSRTNRLVLGITSSLQFHVQTTGVVVMRAQQQVMPGMVAADFPFPYHDNNNEQQALRNESDNSENGSRTDDIIHLNCTSPSCSDDDDDGG
jgi:hypothetical protein